MITDNPSHKAKQAGFLESDRIRTLDLPQNGRLLAIAQSIESAMKAGTTADVRRSCNDFLAETSSFNKTPACDVRVLAARPLRVRESWSSELFGDYNPETMLSRVWMRRAVRKEVTSFGTFLSTLATNSAITSISSGSVLPILGTLAGSMNEPLCFTTMRGEARPSGCFGCL